MTGIVSCSEPLTLRNGDSEVVFSIDTHGRVIRNGFDITDNNLDMAEALIDMCRFGFGVEIKRTK
jgi:hypothetical protein